MDSKIEIKKVGKIAKKIYSQIPKKKIVAKATTYGIGQIIGQTIGGPYVSLLSMLYNKSKKHIISYTGSYAYESLLKSNFAREKINSLPMLIVSIIFRSFLNFLLFSRLVTGYKLFDYIFSIILTVFITIMSPFIYKSITVHENIFMQYTNKFVDKFMIEGWDYIELIKNRTALIGGLSIVLLLQFVEVNSRYLQEIIIHGLITGFISDKIQKKIDNIHVPKRLYYGMTRIDPVLPNILGSQNYILYQTPIYCKEVKPIKAKINPIIDRNNKNITKNKIPVVKKYRSTSGEISKKSKKKGDGKRLRKVVYKLRSRQNSEPINTIKSKSKENLTDRIISDYIN
jgi:hypothetical protein